MFILGTELRSSDLAVSPLTPEPFNHPHLNLHNFWFPCNKSFWNCVVLPLGSSTREYFFWPLFPTQNSDLYKNKSRSGQDGALLISRVRWFPSLWPPWSTQWVPGNQRYIVKPCLKQNKITNREKTTTTNTCQKRARLARIPSFGNCFSDGWGYFPNNSTLSLEAYCFLQKASDFTEGSGVYCKLLLS